MKYSPKTLEYFKSLEFAGEMKNPDAVGQVGNIKCGDVMRVFLKVDVDVITDIRFLTYGCIAAIASSEAMCQLVKGKKIEEALEITAKDIVKELGELPSVKIHCSVLGREALGKAVENYQKKAQK